MNTKKLLIILILTVFVTGICIGGVSAVKTVSINMKSNNYGFSEPHNEAHIGSGDVIHAVNQKKNLQAGKGPMVQLEHSCQFHSESCECGKKYKLTGARFYYKNSKGKVATYTVKSKYSKSKSKYVSDYSFLYGKYAKGWTPYKVLVGYSTLTSADKKAINRYGRGGYPYGSCKQFQVTNIYLNKKGDYFKGDTDCDYLMVSYSTGQLWIQHLFMGDAYLEFDHVDVKINNQWLHVEPCYDGSYTWDLDGSYHKNNYCIFLKLKKTDKVTQVKFYTENLIFN